MIIKNYTYVTGKIVSRPWGVEYRYTVINSDGKYIDDIIMLENDQVSEQTILNIIISKLATIDVEPEPIKNPIEEAKIEKENEIQVFLVTKNLLTVDQEIWDIKSKAQIIVEAQQI